MICYNKGVNEKGVRVMTMTFECGFPFGIVSFLVLCGIGLGFVICEKMK